MGFFSYNCLGCGHSIRAVQATNEQSAWMSRATIVTRDGSILRGEYDGYGRVSGSFGEVELQDSSEFSAYHSDCHTSLGKPEFTKQSGGARDQGFFVGEFDPASPKTRADVDALHVMGK